MKAYFLDKDGVQASAGASANDELPCSTDVLLEGLEKSECPIVVHWDNGWSGLLFTDTPITERCGVFIVEGSKLWFDDIVSLVAPIFPLVWDRFATLPPRVTRPSTQTGLSEATHALLQDYLLGVAVTGSDAQSFAIAWWVWELTGRGDWNDIVSIAHLRRNKPSRVIDLFEIRTLIETDPGLRPKAEAILESFTVIPLALEASP